MNDFYRPGKICWNRCSNKGDHGFPVNLLKHVEELFRLLYHVVL